MLKLAAVLPRTLTAAGAAPCRSQPREAEAGSAQKHVRTALLHHRSKRPKAARETVPPVWRGVFAPS